MLVYTRSKLQQCVPLYTVKWLEHVVSLTSLCIFLGVQDIVGKQFLGCNITAHAAWCLQLAKSSIGVFCWCDLAMDLLRCPLLTSRHWSCCAVSTISGSCYGANHEVWSREVRAKEPVHHVTCMKNKAGLMIRPGLLMIDHRRHHTGAVRGLYCSQV